MSELLELAERCEKASGPDRALGRAIMCSVGGWHRVEPRHARNKHGAYISPDEWIGQMSDGSPTLDSLHGTTMHRDVPDITASLDAALALVERVLPGWEFCLERETGVCRVNIGDPLLHLESEAATLALALLAATLRALSSVSGEGEVK